MTTNTRTTAPQAQSAAVRSTRIGAVPKAAATRLLALVQNVHSYQEMLTHLDPMADAVPKANAYLAGKVKELREHVVASSDTARDNASAQAWALLQAQTGVSKGNLVALQYRHQGELLDAASVIKEERLEVQTLAIAGAAAADFYFELQGTRLLKNGQPGKTAVTVRVYPGLTATVLAEHAADKTPA